MGQAVELRATRHVDDDCITPPGLSRLRRAFGGNERRFFDFGDTELEKECRGIPMRLILRVQKPRF